MTQGPILEIFVKKKLRIDGFEKLSFFESAILEKNILLHPMKSSQSFLVVRMGRNFDDNPGFQPMRSWVNTYAQNCT
jgi:hypothetical protein